MNKQKKMILKDLILMYYFTEVTITTIIMVFWLKTSFKSNLRNKLIFSQYITICIIWKSYISSLVREFFQSTVQRRKIRIVISNLAFGRMKRCYAVSCSNARTLSVNWVLGLSDPVSVTGSRWGWDGSYTTGQHSSLRLNQHRSESRSISERNTLQRTKHHNSYHHSRIWDWLLTAVCSVCSIITVTCIPKIGWYLESRITKLWLI